MYDGVLMTEPLGAMKGQRGRERDGSDCHEREDDAGDRIRRRKGGEVAPEIVVSGVGPAEDGEKTP